MADKVIEASLGAGNTGLTIEYRILQDDGTTEHATWTSANVVEIDSTNLPGHYRVQGKVSVPDDGGFIEVRNSAGSVLLASVPFDPPPIDISSSQTELTGVPAATANLADMIKWIFTLSRNKVTQTSTLQSLLNDSGASNIATSTVSDDGTTFTREEWI